MAELIFTFIEKTDTIKILRSIVNGLDSASMKALTKLAEEARSSMVNTISSMKKESNRYENNKLENAIRVYLEEKSVGVGKKEDLDKEAPYFWFINFGGTVASPSTKTHFVPGEFNGGKFEYDPTAKTGIFLPSGLASNAINKNPMNYVEKAVQHVSKIINVTVEEKINELGKG